MINYTGRKVSDFLIDLHEGKQFSFSRWGDGEWSCIFGNRTQNVDGHRYTDALGVDLINSLAIRGPRMGMQGYAVRRLKGKLYDFVSCTCTGIEWDNADIFHHEEKDAHAEGRLSALVAVLRERHSIRSVLTVGPGPLWFLCDVFQVDRHINIPSRNCYYALDKTIEEMRRAIDALPKPVFVSLSASMAANVIVHRLHGEVDGWLMDLGSMWIPYLPENHGLKVRSYQQGWKAVV